MLSQLIGSPLSCDRVERLAASRDVTVNWPGRHAPCRACNSVNIVVLLRTTGSVVE